jgi:hypothetical protein
MFTEEELFEGWMVLRVGWIKGRLAGKDERDGDRVVCMREVLRFRLWVKKVYN